MEKQKKEDASEYEPSAKRARADEPIQEEDVGLPIPIQLAVPFIPVGDLWALAAASRFCRSTAVASYQKRLESPFSTRRKLVSNEEDNEVVPTTKPVVVDEFHLCYHKYNPWSNLHIQRHRSRFNSSLSAAKIHSDEKVEWKADPNMLLEWQEGTLQRPQELPNTNPSCIVYYDLRGSSLFVTIVKYCSLNGEEVDEYDPDDPDTAKELWAVLYDLNQKDSNGKFQPVLAQKLLDEPIGIEWSVDCDWVSFGHAHRSGNGKVVAVVTAIPNRMEPAEVTVFDVTDSGFVEKGTILVTTFGSEPDYSTIKLSMSTGGEVLAILNEEKYDQEGSLAFYDLRDEAYPLIRKVDGFAFSGENSAYFTPDNDFVLQIAENSTRNNIQELEFPRLAGRVVYVE